MLFHEQLSALRRAKGISQEALAEQLGISRQAVSKWETGTAKPELDNILALCRILEVSPNELLGVPTSEPAETPVSPDSPSGATATPSTSGKQKSPVRTILLYFGCIILLILLGLGYRNTVDQGYTPKIESCTILRTRPLENAREFTLKITYSFVPEDQPNQIDFWPYPKTANPYPLSITMEGNVGYVTFLLPYDAEEYTLQHTSLAKRTHYLRDIFKIKNFSKDDYQAESLV